MASLQRLAFETFGPDRQLLALAEEAAELAAAATRLLNGKGDRADVLAEIVDVQSVAESLREYLGSEVAWATIRGAKERKLLEVLEAGDPRTRPTKGGR